MSAHGVTHIDQLVLPHVLRHMEQHSWKIELTHLIPGELPEIFLVRVKVGVVPAVDIASEIAQPDIISSIGQKETWDIGIQLQLEGLGWVTVIEKEGSSQS